jgi:hypothetical protein
MTGGLNLLVNIRRQSQADDDSVGGANVTGTFVYELIPASIRQNMPSDAQRIQGLESQVTYNFTVQGMRGGTLITLYEKDEVVVMQPINHPYANQTFRITGVNTPTQRISRSRLHCTLRRTRYDRREHF